MMPLSIEETAELCRLCQEGMFLEVQEWIRTGKDTVPQSDAGQNPLCVAAGKGFHSLVKLLCTGAHSQEVLDKALGAAVAGGNVETANLLLQSGATLASVDSREVFRSPNVEIVGWCMAAGVDLATNMPLARELLDRSETALRYFERWHAEIDTLRDQGAVALISFVRDDNEYWVRCLMDAGASPRRRVTSLSCRYEEEFPRTALEVAAFRGTFRMLLRLGARKSDDLQALLKETCWDCDLAKMKHLLGRGAKLNDRDDGGSSLMQECLRAMGRADHLGWGEKSRHAWEAIVELARMGARWVPDPRELSVVRCGFRHADFDRCIRFAEVMLQSKAADHAILAKLFGSHKMRERFVEHGEGRMAAVLGERWWQPYRGRRNRHIS